MNVVCNNSPNLVALLLPLIWAQGTPKNCVFTVNFQNSLHKIIVHETANISGLLTQNFTTYLGTCYQKDFEEKMIMIEERWRKEDMDRIEKI